jgi:hypothetical protein
LWYVFGLRRKALYMNLLFSYKRTVRSWSIPSLGCLRATG